MIESIKEEDRQFMRKFVQETLFEGGDIETLHLVYDLLKDQFASKYTPKQIDGVISWKLTPEGTLVLEKDYEAIERYRNWTREKAQKITAPQPIKPTINTPIAEEQSTEDNNEHFNFNNETKNRWREEWSNFLNEKTTPEERRTMKVLCLPGKACLEIPVYLNLGFAPENIHGWLKSADEAVRQEFLQQADELGFNPHIGDLHSNLRLDTETYDVVSLDFFGQFSRKAYEIISRLPVAERVFMLTNFLGKRERGDMQRQLKLYTAQNELAKAGMSYETLTELEDQIRDGEDDISMSDVRKIPFGQLGLFIERTERWMFPNRMLSLETIFAKPGEYVNKSDEASGEIYCQICNIQRLLVYLLDDIEIVLQQVRHSFLDGRKLQLKRPLDLTQRLYTFSTINLLGIPYTQDLRKFSYYSQNSHSKSPFISDFSEIKSPLNRLNKYRRSAAFILECIEGITMSRANEESGGGHWFSLRTKQDRPMQVGGRISKSDILTFEVSGKRHSQIRIGKFIDDVTDFYTNVHLEHFKVEPELKADIPRVAIEDLA